MTSRDNELRRQAEETCARRTRELEDARTALARQAEDAELGRALRELAKQVTRLRRTPGVPFGFTPGGVARSVEEELAEVIAAEPGSTDAHGEIGDLLSTVLSLAKAHKAPVLTTISNAAGKLERRLDLVDMGATWHDAKVAEANERDIEDADAKWAETVAKAAPYMPGGEHFVEACDGDHAQGDCSAPRCIRRDTTTPYLARIDSHGKAHIIAPVDGKCTREECPAFDGKRCAVISGQPGEDCEAFGE